LLDEPALAEKHAMTAAGSRIRSFAPQLLVDDLDRAIAFYRDIPGLSFGPAWRGFCAIGERDGSAVHLKCAPKTVEDRSHRRQHEHLDIYASVTDVRALHDACQAKGATIIKPLARTAWGTSDFYILDPEGYILAFGENESSS
jgi:catechol 2,3-dioxygenase-like lactoylglutathione lyase family enzyme